MSLHIIDMRAIWESGLGFTCLYTFVRVTIWSHFPRRRPKWPHRQRKKRKMWALKSINHAQYYVVLVRQYNLVPILKHCVMQSMCHDGFKMDVNKFKGMPGSLSNSKGRERETFLFLPYMPWYIVTLIEIKSHIIFPPEISGKWW